MAEIGAEAEAGAVKLSKHRAGLSTTLLQAQRHRTRPMQAVGPTVNLPAKAGTETGATG